MDFLKKNKLIVGLIIIVILVIAGAFAFMKLSGNKPQEAQPADQSQSIKTVSPQDIGLSLSLTSDKKSVNMEITKLGGIKSVSYEADYMANVKDPDTGEMHNIQQAVISSDIDTSGQSSIKKNFVLGTCSAGRDTLSCHYDDVTSDITFKLKLNYADGSIGSVTDTLPFK